VKDKTIVIKQKQKDKDSLLD